MEKFYQERVTKHEKKMMRYMKYVFNDHFVLIGMILLGGCAMTYADFVKTLSPEFTLGKPILILFSLLLIFSGKLATLIQEADKVFLLPKEQEMQQYFKAAYKHSILLPLVFCVIGVGVMMPLLVAVSSFQFKDYFLFVFLIIILKLSQLHLQMEKLFLNSENSYKKHTLFFSIISVFFLSVSFYVHPIIGIIGSAFIFVISFRLSQKNFQEEQLDWEKMIRLENTRLRSIYQFINLFTDVPGLSGTVKRRKLLDGLLNRSKKIHENTFFYLYSRSFIRGTEYSGLFVRLVLIGALIQFMLPAFIYSLLVPLLFIYLIGFQLIPLYSQFNYMVMTQLYPVAVNQKKQAMTKLLGILLLVVSGIFSIIALVVLKNWQQFALIAASLFIETVLFVKMYVPLRLKKMNHS